MTAVRKGDIVRVVLEGEVVHVSDPGRFLLGPYWFNNNQIVQSAEHVKSIEVLTPAPLPKPKAGDVITGQDMRAIRWKRGSIVKHATAVDGHAGWVLAGDGLWYSLEAPTISHRFGAFTATYKVVFVA